MRSRVMMGALMALVAALVVGCSGGGDTTPVQAQLGATLRGEQVVPPVATVARGSATVNLEATNTAINATVTTANVTGVQRVAIAEGAPGENGPTLFVLWDTQVNGAWPGSVTRRLTGADILSGSFTDAIGALVAGRTYALVTTTTNPNGFLRGQIGPVQLQAGLSGANVVPPSGSVASGVAAVLVNAPQTSATVSLNTVGLTGVQAVEIRLASAGQRGPVIFTLATTNFTGSLARTISAADLTPQPEENILTFQDAVSAMIAGQTYITIRTTDFRGGEIRGQLVPTTVL